jgi:DNA-binding beta-propeller fold protein YncE
MKKLFSAFLTISLLMVAATGSLADTNKWYYLSSSGYLIRLDLESVTETGQVAAGLMPWGAASCGGHIYFSDFGSDQVFDFSPEDKVLNKVKIDDESNFGLNKVEYFVKEEKKVKKSYVQTAFEKIHKPKIQPAKYDETAVPLPVASHNKKVGLGAIACNNDYLFVVSTLKNQVEVISRKELKRVASLGVGERPSGVAVSPNGNNIAISSTAQNKLYIGDATGSFTKKNEIIVEEGPTDMVWIGDSKVFVLNRGQNSVSIVDPTKEAAIKNVQFDSPVNALVSSADGKLVYVLDGTDKKLFLLNTNNYEYQTKEIAENLKFPNLLNLISPNELLVGSESDGRFLILSTETFESTKKIQTNLPPKILVKVIDQLNEGKSGQVADNQTKKTSKQAN